MRSVLALLEFFAVFNCQRLRLLLNMALMAEILLLLEVASNLNAVQAVVVEQANAAVNTAIAVPPQTIVELDVKAVPVVPRILLHRILHLLLKNLQRILHLLQSLQRILHLLLKSLQRILHLLLKSLQRILHLLLKSLLLLQNRTL